MIGSDKVSGHIGWQHCRRLIYKALDDSAFVYILQTRQIAKHSNTQVVTCFTTRSYSRGNYNALGCSAVRSVRTGDVQNSRYQQPSKCSIWRVFLPPSLLTDGMTRRGLIQLTNSCISVKLECSEYGTCTCMPVP